MHGNGVYSQRQEITDARPASRRRPGRRCPRRRRVLLQRELQRTGLRRLYLRSGRHERPLRPTNYSYINDFDGWTFTPDATFLAQPVGGTNGAVLLNENGSGGQAYVTVGGLTAGQTYALRFLLSGDNRPGETYVLNVGVDPSQYATFTGVDGAAGSTAGTIEKFVFEAGGTAGQPTTTAIGFTQSSPSEASPLIDNVAVTNVPEPAAWTLLIAGFAAIGTAARRRRLLAA